MTGGDWPPGLVMVRKSESHFPVANPFPSAWMSMAEVVNMYCVSIVNDSKSILSLQILAEFLQMVYVQGSVSDVVLKEVMMAYVLFSEAEPPQARLKVQQTPNPDAQLPLALPPLAVHS